MDLKQIVRSSLEEMKDELLPLKSALSDDALDDYSDTIEVIIQKIDTLFSAMDNSDLSYKLSSI